MRKECSHKWKPHIIRTGVRMRGELCETCGAFQFSPSDNGYVLISEYVDGVNTHRLVPKEASPWGGEQADPGDVRDSG